MLRALTPRWSRTTPLGKRWVVPPSSGSCGQHVQPPGQFGPGRGPFLKLAQQRVLRFDALHQAWIQNGAAVGQGGRQHGDLERGDQDGVLANGHVGGVAFGPTGAHLLQGGRVTF